MRLIFALTSVRMTWGLCNLIDFTTWKTSTEDSAFTWSIEEHTAQNVPVLPEPFLKGEENKMVNGTLQYMISSREWVVLYLHLCLSVFLRKLCALGKFYLQWTTMVLFPQVCWCCWRRPNTSTTVDAAGRGPLSGQDKNWKWVTARVLFSSSCEHRILLLASMFNIYSIIQTAALALIWVLFF